MSIPDVSTAIRGRPILCNKRVLELAPNKDYASVVFIGDTHLGSPECHEEKLYRMIKWCQDNDTYVFLMGDIVEAATRYSIGAGVYEQARTRFGTVTQQYEACLELLGTLANQGKILGMVSGNHEDRIAKATGFDITRALCRELKIRYLGSAGWNYWRVGNQGYRIYTLHGSSGSKYSYTKLKALVDISHSFEADLMAMGHVHECTNTIQLVQTFDKKTGKIVERKKHILITGHYLKYEGYAKAKGLPLTKLGSPKVKLFGSEHDIHVSW